MSIFIIPSIRILSRSSGATAHFSIQPNDCLKGYGFCEIIRPMLTKRFLLIIEGIEYIKASSDWLSLIGENQ